MARSPGWAVGTCLGAETETAATHQPETWPAVDVLVVRWRTGGDCCGRSGQQVSREPKCLMAERYGRLGGMAVQAMVGPLMGKVESAWVDRIIERLGGRRVDYEFADLKVRRHARRSGR